MIVIGLLFMILIIPFTVFMLYVYDVFLKNYGVNELVYNIIKIAISY